MRKLTPPEINWKAVPFFRLTIPLMLGIYLAERLNIHHPSLNVLLATLFFCIFYFKRRLKTYTLRWIPGVLINVFLFVFGYQLTYLHNETHQPTHFLHQLQSENTIIGVVENDPSIKKGKIKVVLNTQFKYTQTNQIANCNGKLLAYLYDKEGARSVKYGDQLLLKTRILPVQKAQNPNAFDYQQYLYFQNIHYQAFVYPQNWKIIDSNLGSTFQQKILHIRKGALALLKKHIPYEKEAAIAAALILGYKDNLSQDLKKAYAESGAIHVLAVSGLHVGIVSGLLLFLLNIFPIKGRFWNFIKLGLVLMIIWIFAFLTGMPASVQRAAIMFSALHFGLVIEREINIYNSLAVAAFWLLIANPFALFDIGFQFSFLAVIGIVFFSPKLLKFWTPKSKLTYRAWQLTVVGIGAQIAVFPLSLYYFHQVPTYFWLTGLFVIPFASIILYGGIALLICGCISHTLAGIVGWLIGHVIAFQNLLISWIQEFPFHILNGFWISQTEVFLFYGFIFGIAMQLLTYRPQWIIASLSCLFMVSCVQLTTDYSQIKQKKIIIYAINKSSAIDFIDGLDIYTLFDTKLTESQEIYAIQNSRWAAGIDNVLPINEAKIQTSHLFKKGNVLKFYDKTLVIINENYTNKGATNKLFECDFLLFQNNPTINLDLLIKQFSFKEIIFDGSNTNWKIKQWKTTCDKLSIPYRDVKQEGAYVIDLTKEQPENQAALSKHYSENEVARKNNQLRE